MTSCYVVTRWGRWGVEWVGTFRTLPEATAAASGQGKKYALVLEVDSATMETREVKWEALHG